MSFYSDEITKIFAQHEQLSFVVSGNVVIFIAIVKTHFYLKSSVRDFVKLRLR